MCLFIFTRRTKSCLFDIEEQEVFLTFFSKLVDSLIIVTPSTPLHRNMYKVAENFVRKKKPLYFIT